MTGPHDKVQLAWDNGLSAGASKASAAGNFKVEQVVPAMTAGSHSLTAIDSSAGCTLVSNVQVDPRLVLSSKTARSGANMTATLTGFDGGVAVNLTWMSPSGAVTGAIETGASGSGTSTFSVPTVTKGTYFLYATDAEGAIADSPFKGKK